MYDGENKIRHGNKFSARICAENKRRRLVARKASAISYVRIFLSQRSIENSQGFKTGQIYQRGRKYDPNYHGEFNSVVIIKRASGKKYGHGAQVSEIKNLSENYHVIAQDK
jgi:hypothetical protein